MSTTRQRARIVIVFEPTPFAGYEYALVALYAVVFFLVIGLCAFFGVGQ